MAQKDYMDLLELQLRIREAVGEAFEGRYWVKAEISSWSPRTNGHCYLELSQSQGGRPVAQSRAMIWKWYYPRLKAFFEQTTGQALQAGITVLVKVQVSYSELYGISLFIEDIDPAFTLGEKALERKRAIEKLTAGGYMEMQKELALPDLPYRLAVITSKTAAGYGDFRRHLLENPQGYAFRLDLHEALMQGEQAPASIMSALLDAEDKGYDAILILRGGGSELDLSCFDDYELAVAIASCPVPVITAIGHDRDVHIADMVAHASVKTPTALADLFLDAYQVQDQMLDRLFNRVQTAALRLVGGKELELGALDTRVQRAVQLRLSTMQRDADALEARIRLGLNRKLSALENTVSQAVGRISRGFLHKYAAHERVADGLVHRLRFAAQARVSQEVSSVALKEALIKASDPRNILSLGYVLVTGKDNKVLKTVEKVRKGDRIGVRFTDGSLTAKVDEVYSEKRDNDKINIA
ncbi:MAG: exodeoxyribonuclease VII large subunit [Bacteroidales bacterium]|nr:exodeoxyribonuclease VII large subunit [Bacteroidales bacterium]